MKKTKEQKKNLASTTVEIPRNHSSSRRYLTKKKKEAPGMGPDREPEEKKKKKEKEADHSVDL